MSDRGTATDSSQSRITLSYNARELGGSNVVGRAPRERSVVHAVTCELLDLVTVTDTSRKMLDPSLTSRCFKGSNRHDLSSSQKGFNVDIEVPLFHFAQSPRIPFDSSLI